MHRYAVFGGCLESEIAFPELPEELAIAPNWTLIVKNSDSAAPELGKHLGSDTVYGSCYVHCHRLADGFCLVYDDTGRFDVSSDGRTLLWFRPPDVSEEAARADVIGRVMALALHVQGIATLHASAVSIGGRAIVFVAPKYAGKSTLATALVNAGARLLADDAVPLRGGAEPTVAPGIARLRLWEDSAATVMPGRGSHIGNSRKVLVDDLDAARIESKSSPLGAIYALSAVVGSPDEPAVVRSRVHSIHAALTLVQHARLGPLLGGVESGVILTQMADLAERVDIFELYTVRDLARLGEVVQTIFSWHSDSTVPASETTLR
jgi:hypothetical protein